MCLKRLGKAKRDEKDTLGIGKSREEEHAL
jgi:hypothetical protein